MTKKGNFQIRKSYEADRFSEIYFSNAYEKLIPEIKHVIKGNETKCKTTIGTIDCKLEGVSK